MGVRHSQRVEADVGQVKAFSHVSLFYLQQHHTRVTFLPSAASPTCHFSTFSSISHVSLFYLQQHLPRVPFLPSAAHVSLFYLQQHTCHFSTFSSISHVSLFYLQQQWVSTVMSHACRYCNRKRSGSRKEMRYKGARKESV